MGAQGLAQGSFRLAQAVGVRVVKKVDTLIQRGVDCPDQLLLLHNAPAMTAHGTAAHTEPGNPEI